MSTTGPRGMGFSPDRPHAYDPLRYPELFDAVLARRMVALVIDIVVISLPIMLGGFFFLFFSLITLGLGWFLFSWVLYPASLIWTLFYYGITLGGPHSATVGMRVMNLQMRTWYGGPSYFLYGVAHAILFWLSVSLLSPFVLLVGFFNDRRRLLHDMAIGAVIVNDPTGIAPAGEPPP